MSRTLGDAAEERAVSFLKAKGYAVVERNFRAKVGELDIVARDGETVVFVEVRSRGRTSFASAAETIGRDKRRKLLLAAKLYAQARGLDCPMRFDVLAEGPDGFEHFEDAFGL